MSVPPPRSRRVFLADLGRVTIGLVVLGVAACADDSGAASTTSATASTTLPASTPATTAGTMAPPTSATSTTNPQTPATAWERVFLGNVSAYVVVRAGEATVVDTGNPGSESAIEATLDSLSVTWDAVAQVILTHDHNDHQGSIGAVMAAAAAAAAYAGAEDIPDITAPRPLVAVGDGDSVAGLDIIATPGHTPGHISVLDSTIGLLIAGDALNGEAGGVVGPAPQYTADLAVANASVAKLAGFQFDTVVFGHGDPVLSGASGLVAALAAQL